MHPERASFCFHDCLMMYSINNTEDLEKLNGLIALQNQVKSLRLQGGLGKQNFFEDMKKLIEPSLKRLKMSLQM